MDSIKNQSVNRAKRAAAIKVEILDQETDFVDIFDLERATGMSLRHVDREISYASDDGVIAQLFDKVG
jgi:hypothetical protein